MGNVELEHMLAQVLVLASAADTVSVVNVTVTGGSCAKRRLYIRKLSL